MPRFSVVVPVYKAEEYLEECVRSVLSQNYDDFELILVDDGSPDNCGKICDSLAAGDNRIHVIHQENRGHITARINGVKASAGEYVIFLDCDDYWFDGLLKKADSKISEYGCDILVFRLEKNGKPCFDFFAGEKGGIEHAEYLRVNLAQPMLNCLPIKVFKRELFEGVDISQFASFRNSEDLLLSVDLVCRCRKISYIPDVLYFYRVNPSGITNNYNPNVLNEFIASRELLVRKIDEYSAFGEADRRVLNTAFLWRAADTVLQISMSRMTAKEKITHYKQIRKMDYFQQAMSFADFSGFGAAKKLRLMLLKKGLLGSLMLTDKFRTIFA